MTRALLTAALTLGAALPFALLLTLSFAGRWYYPHLLPTEWSTRAWASLLSPEARLLEATWGSTWTAGITAVLATLLALPAARALARRPRTGVRALLLAPLVLPAFASAMGVQVVFLRLGLADTGVGVVLAHLMPVTPYALVLLTGVFETYDTRLDAQACSLGARPLQVLLHVTLPAVRAGLLASVLIAFLVSWSEYLLTLIIGGSSVLTLPILLLASAQGGDTALTAATALVYATPPLLVFTLLGRRFMVARA